MPNFGTPVADQVAPVTSGIQTLSALMSLKQQQIGIARQQIGLSQAQQELSQQTSQATMANIQATQQQALRAIDWKQFVNKDGSYDVQGATQAALQAAPNIGPEFVSRLENMAQEGAATQKAYYSLNQDYQNSIRAAFGTWAEPGNKSQVSDLAAQLQAIQEDAPASTQKNIGQIIKHTLGIMTGPNLITGQPNSLEQQKAAALAYSRAGLSPSEVSGAGGTATPATTLVSTGGNLVPVAQSRTTGAITREPGAIPTTISPQVVTQPGTEAKYIVWPNGTVTPLGAAAAAAGGPAAKGAAAAPAVSGGAPGGAAGTTRQPANWWQPAPGQTQLLHANTAALASRIQAGEQAANTSPTAIDALTRARAILDQGVSTGGTFSGFKDLKNTLSSLTGIDWSGAQNASELAKNLARYEAARAGSVGSTDAARSLYEAGAPNTKMDAAAVKAVVMQSLGVEKMIQGYAKIVGGAPTPQVAQQREQAFRSIPHLVQAYELGFMRNQSEAEAFFQRYGVSGRELAKSAEQLRKLGAM